MAHAEPDTYRPRTTAGVYVPTAPTAAPQWPRVKPFALTSASQFRPAPPIALDSAEWAADYNEIKELGGRASAKRSAQQTEDARFWLVVDGRGYYPVIRTVAEARKLSLVDSARLFALAAVAREDALIAVFDAKYHYEFWRPVTAIRNGDIDNNSATERDPAWAPIDATPMHPEYPCAHCISSASLVGVMEVVFGTAEMPEVSIASPTAPGVVHHWTNIRAFSDEVSEARIWAGFHYRSSTKSRPGHGPQDRRVCSEEPHAARRSGGSLNDWGNRGSPLIGSFAPACDYCCMETPNVDPVDRTFAHMRLRGSRLTRPHKAGHKGAPAVPAHNWHTRPERHSCLAKTWGTGMNTYVHAAQRTPDTANLHDGEVVCLWSMFGLVLTGLAHMFGFGIEIGQALINAG